MKTVTVIGLIPLVQLKEGIMEMIDSNIPFGRQGLGFVAMNYNYFRCMLQKLGLPSADSTKHGGRGGIN